MTQCLRSYRLLPRRPARVRALRRPGFGWKTEEIIGAQIIVVPMSVPLQIADRAYTTLLLFLCITMAIAIFALDAVLVSSDRCVWFRIWRTLSRGEKNVLPGAGARQ